MKGGRCSIAIFAILLSACSEDEAKIAEDACPFIIRMSNEQELQKLELLTDRGLDPQVASRRLFEFKKLIRMTSIRDYDHAMQLCVMSLSTDEFERGEILREAAKTELRRRNADVESDGGAS